MKRMMANLLFALAIGAATLLNTMQVPLSRAIAALMCVLLIACFSYFSRVRFAGFVGFPGMAYLYSHWTRQNPLAAEIILITAGLCITGMLLADPDLATPAKGEKTRTHETA